MRAPRIGTATLAILVAAIVLGAIAAAPSNAAPSKGAPASAASAATDATAPAPFARVYLALRGCTSCAHCRTTIRQMTKGSAKGGETRVNGDQVEVLYAKPRVVPLRDVIQALADNRLHDLSLVDVFFEAKGVIGNGADGALTFTLDETGQVFPISLADHVKNPVSGRPVRLVALVEGWRKKGALTLVARDVQAAV
ncbi:MAG: hypothetical protein AABZ94_07660 [Candidatus Eisenbacteria bacterium]